DFVTRRTTASGRASSTYCPTALSSWVRHSKPRTSARGRAATPFETPQWCCTPLAVAQPACCAMAGDDDAALAEARQRVMDEMGPAEMVDAAGIASNFERMVRIADGCGIALDERMTVMTEDIRENLGINAFTAAANSKPAQTGV
ncbi:MAG: hypothetical protein AAF512_17025, partial [Pseudomonadota bacterium]